MAAKREHFGSRAAVIMAMAGSAIGLGNIWRFPYMVGEYGGAAFILVFILCWVNAFRIFKEVYFIGGAYPDEPIYTLQNYMNNMYSKLNYQNVTTAAYSFAVIVFVLFGLLFWLQSRAQRGLS